MLHACRSWIEKVSDRSTNELAVRARVRNWVLHNASEILAPLSQSYHWNLPAPSGTPLDMKKMRMDERRFTLDVALGLMQARIWDEPALMHSVRRAQEACSDVCFSPQFFTFLFHLFGFL
jgi:hypothetical protein